MIAPDPAIRDDCTYRQGNPCLLTGVNRALEDREFEQKRKTYAQSDLPLTSELKDYVGWDSKTIENDSNRWPSWLLPRGVPSSKPPGR